MPALYLLPHTVHVTFSLPWNWWAGKDSNLRRQKPADLQSAPFGRLGYLSILLNGADDQIRTGNLLITNQLLFR